MLAQAKRMRTSYNRNDPRTNASTDGPPSNEHKYSRSRDSGARRDNAQECNAMLAEATTKAVQTAMNKLNINEDSKRYRDRATTNGHDSDSSDE